MNLITYFTPCPVMATPKCPFGLYYGLKCDLQKKGLKNEIKSPKVWKKYISSTIIKENCVACVGSIERNKQHYNYINIYLLVCLFFSDSITSHLSGFSVLHHGHAPGGSMFHCVSSMYSCYAYGMGGKTYL